MSGISLYCFSFLFLCLARVYHVLCIQFSNQWPICVLSEREKEGFYRHLKNIFSTWTPCAQFLRIHLHAMLCLLWCVSVFAYRYVKDNKRKIKKNKIQFYRSKFYRILRALESTNIMKWLVYKTYNHSHFYLPNHLERYKKSYFSTIYVNSNISSNHNDNWKLFLFPARALLLPVNLSPRITLLAPLNMPLFYCFLFCFCQNATN